MTSPTPATAGEAPHWLAGFRKTRRPLLLGHRGRLVLSVETTIPAGQRTPRLALSPRLRWLVQQLDSTRVPATFIVAPERTPSVVLPLIDSPLEHELAVHLSQVAIDTASTGLKSDYLRELQAAGIPLRTAATRDDKAALSYQFTRCGISNLIHLKATGRFTNLAAVDWNLHQLPVSFDAPVANDWFAERQQERQLLLAAEEAQTLHVFIDTERVPSWASAQRQLTRLLTQAADLRDRGMLTPVTQGELAAAYAVARNRRVAA